MNQIQNAKIAAAKEIDEYECSGNGPRPRVPGKESRPIKMSDRGYASSSTIGATVCVAQDDILADCARVKRWRDNLSTLLSDEEGAELFQKFVEEEAGPDGPYTRHLQFYFACNGLKKQTDPETVQQFIRAIFR